MNKNLTTLAVLVGVLFIAVFYWFEYRPTQIKKNCWRIAPSTIEGNTEKNYQSCLRDYGLME
jgi:hypothetical protein